MVNIFTIGNIIYRLIDKNG